MHIYGRPLGQAKSAMVMGGEGEMWGGPFCDIIVLVSELVNQVNTNNARRRLRLATIGDLIVPRTRTNFGQHAFATAGPIAWNSLPTSVRSASSIAIFKKKLKTNSLF